MMKPWLEKWTADGGYVRVPADDRDGFFGEKDFWGDSCPGISLTAMEQDEQRAKLAAGAPAMARALLAVEYGEDGAPCHGCPLRRGEGHFGDCPVHLGLKAAGLDTDAKRDAARADIEAAREAVR